MKRLLLFIAFCFIVNGIYSQPYSWTWAKSFGAPLTESSTDICVDASGNIFTTGAFTDSVFTMGNFVLHNPSQGNADIFIAKFDASGNVLWAKSAAGMDYDAATSICTDANGDVYITGTFPSEYLDFGDTILYNADTSNYGRDFYIAKYNTIGDLLWVRNATGSKNIETVWGICSDLNNNVYITGDFNSDTLTLGNITLVNRGNEDIFIAKLDANGNYIWAKNAGGSLYDSGSAICCDALGNIYVAGDYSGHAIFDNDTLIGNVNRNVFVSKYDSNGDLIWVRSPLGPGDPESYSQYIAVSPTGDVYITGFYYDFIIFGNDILVNNGAPTVFLAKYDNNGNPIWGKCPSQSGPDFAGGICTDMNGNVFTSGYFGSNTIDFGGNVFTSSDGNYLDGYIAEYDPNGQVIWATNLAGNNHDFPLGICNSGSNIYMTGRFASDTLIFGSDILINKSDSNRNDAFIAKLDITTGIVENNYSSWNLFPNPTSEWFTISNNQSANVHLEIYNEIGEKIYTSVFSYRETIRKKLPAGIYFLKISEGGKQFTKKLVVQ